MRLPGKPILRFRLEDLTNKQYEYFKHKEDLFMKKTTKITLAVLMCTAVLAGCAKTEDANQAASSAVEESSAETPLQIANPWSDVSLQEIEERFGTTFALPEGAENVHCMIMEEDGLGDISFDYMGRSCTYRMKNTDIEEDIAGMYYEWNTVETVLSHDCDATYQTCTEDDDLVELATWYNSDEKMMYSLSTVGAPVEGYDIWDVAGSLYTSGKYYSGH